MSNGLSMTTLTSNFSNISILKNPRQKNKEFIKNGMIFERDDEHGSASNHQSSKADLNF
jgi:hypothetical protein